MPGPFTRYDQMPLDPVEAQMELFEAGPIAIGVEYRLLTDAIAAASELEAAQGDTRGQAENLDDRGVSIHVFAIDANQASGRSEILRFDCFDEDPHYHYICWREKWNEIAHLDPVALGDPLAWALDAVRTRLPQMLERAGSSELAGRIDFPKLEAVMPRVAEAAWRARFHHDAEAVEASALSAGATS